MSRIFWVLDAQRIKIDSFDAQGVLFKSEIASVSGVKHTHHDLEGFRPLDKLLSLGFPYSMEEFEFDPPISTEPSIPKLTPRQEQVLSLLAQGKTNREIAITLNIQVQSVKNVISEIMSSTKLRNRVELALKYHGLL